MSKGHHRVEDYVYYPPMPEGIVETYAGRLTDERVMSGHRLLVALSSMWSCCLSGDGGLFTANILNNTVVKIDKRGHAGPWVGTGASGYLNGPRKTAQLSGPAAVHVIQTGELLIADKGNNCLRTLGKDNNVEIFAGSRDGGSKDGPFLTAQFYAPVAICEIPTGAILVCDNSSRSLRVLIGGLVSTFTPPSPAGPVRNFFSDPTGITHDEATGNTYVISRTSSIEYIDPKGQVKRLISNDDIDDSNTKFHSPWTAIVAPNGELIVSDEYSHMLQAVNPETKAIETLCGCGVQGFREGPKADAQFQHIACMSLTPLGDLLIADRTNHLVRRLRESRYQTRNFDLDDQLSLSELTEATFLPSTTLKFANRVETTIHTALLGARCPLALKEPCQISLSTLEISPQSAAVFHSYIYSDAIVPVDQLQISELVVRSY